MKRILFTSVFFVSTLIITQNYTYPQVPINPVLSITQEDIRIIQSPEGGYHVYIRKKDGVESILLTETTRDPRFKADNYAYRAKEWNPINGDEKRLLDGKFIPEEKKLYSLIDSTPEKNDFFSQSFHIWIPWIIEYGYEWSRNGEVQVLDGTYINIRAFAKPYADYSGAFQDNPYRLRVTQKPVVAFIPPKVSSPTEEHPLATISNGEVLYANGADDLIPLIRSLLVPPGDKSIDLVFVIDATESMIDDIGKLRELMEPFLQEVLPSYPSYRIGLVLYKDYFEDFLIKTACPFTSDISVFRKALSSFRVQGGRDIPEAVYEGLDAALQYPWNPSSDKRILLIGDAPPHPKPRGKISKESVDAKASKSGVKMDVIILPHGDTY